MRGNLLSLAMALAVLAGCGSTPTKVLPLRLQEGTQEFAVKLETSSRLVVLRKGCDPKRKDLFLVVRGNGHHGDAAGEQSCTLLPKFSAFRTKEAFGKGEYVVEAGRGEGTVVTADPEDPEALSGPDQDFAGAVELAENQTSKGTVSYAGANQTNWVQVAGAKGDVSLLFLPEPGGEVEAMLYVLPPGAASPRKIAKLAPKAKRVASPDAGTLYVKVSAKKFSGDVGYSIVRRDLQKVKSTSIAVVDFYPVDGKSSVLLLPKAEGLKAQDSLKVTGVRGGKAVSFGRCVVTSLSETQASCRLDAVPEAGVSKLRAELVQEGGKS